MAIQMLLLAEEREFPQGQKDRLVEAREGLRGVLLWRLL